MVGMGLMKTGALSSLECSASSELTAGVAVPASYSSLTACEAADMTRDGRLTAEALARSCLERIAKRDGEVRAWSFVDPQHALTRARLGSVPRQSLRRVLRI